MGDDVRGWSGEVAESERRLRKRCTHAQHQKPTQTGVRTEMPSENGVKWGYFVLAGSTGLRGGSTGGQMPGPVVPVAEAGSTGGGVFVLNSSGSALVSSKSRIFGKIQGNWLNTNEDLVPKHQICGSKSQITSQIKRSAPKYFGLYFWYFRNFPRKIWGWVGVKSVATLSSDTT